jgi:hypothetical protein
MTGFELLMLALAFVFIAVLVSTADKDGGKKDDDEQR